MPSCSVSCRDQPGRLTRAHQLFPLGPKQQQQQQHPVTPRVGAAPAWMQGEVTPSLHKAILPDHLLTASCPQPARREELYTVLLFLLCCGSVPRRAGACICHLTTCSKLTLPLPRRCCLCTKC